LTKRAQVRAYKSKESLMNMNRRIWAGAVMAGIAALALTACDDVTIKVSHKNSTKGSGVSASETRALPQFSAVDLAGVGKLILKVGEGSNYSVKVTADDNLLPLVETKVSGDTLRIQLKDSVSISNSASFVYEVTAPKIDKLESSGAAAIEGSGFNGGSLRLGVSGVGSVKLNGRVETFRADLSGAGSLNAEGLIANDVKVDLSGVGSADVHADQRIRANVSGLGSITWHGSATDVKSDVSGLGSVRKSGSSTKSAEIKINV
jgi:Putative auto-transporter adhesin, head GIN domain